MVIAKQGEPASIRTVANISSTDDMRIDVDPSFVAKLPQGTGRWMPLTVMFFN
jgi:hypothetical protein